MCTHSQHCSALPFCQLCHVMAWFGCAAVLVQIYFLPLSCLIELLMVKLLENPTYVKKVLRSTGENEREPKYSRKGKQKFSLVFSLSNCFVFQIGSTVFYLPNFVVVKRSFSLSLTTWIVVTHTHTHTHLIFSLSLSHADTWAWLYTRVDFMKIGSI